MLALLRERDRRIVDVNVGARDRVARSGLLLHVDLGLDQLAAGGGVERRQRDRAGQRGPGVSRERDRRSDRGRGRLRSAEAGVGRLEDQVVGSRAGVQCVEGDVVPGAADGEWIARAARGRRPGGDAHAHGAGVEDRR